jgi:ribosomal protein L29
MANKEKEIELKAKADKISKEHLEELQKLVNAINGAQFNLGKMEVQKHETLHQITEVQRQITNLQNTFEKEYGTYDINITDGTINSPGSKKDEK